MTVSDHPTSSPFLYPRLLHLVALYHESRWNGNCVPVRNCRAMKARRFTDSKQDWKQKVETIGENIRFGGIEKIGAPGGIRTPNPQIRSLMLYPVELRARFV